MFITVGHTDTVHSDSMSVIHPSICMEKSGQSNLTKKTHCCRTWNSVVLTRLCQYTPLSNICFLGPTRVHIPYDNSIGSVIFAKIMTECPCTLQWAAPFLLKVSPSHGGFGPHLIQLWANLSPHPKRYFDRFSSFCRAHDCNRQTD